MKNIIHPCKYCIIIPMCNNKCNDLMNYIEKVKSISIIFGLVIPWIIIVLILYITHIYSSSIFYLLLGTILSICYVLGFLELEDEFSNLIPGIILIESLNIDERTAKYIANKYNRKLR